MSKGKDYRQQLVQFKRSIINFSGLERRCQEHLGLEDTFQKNY